MSYVTPASNCFDKIVHFCGVDGVPVTSLQLSTSGNTAH